jgi:hypothetical protein
MPDTEGWPTHLPQTLGGIPAEDFMVALSQAAMERVLETYPALGAVARDVLVAAVTAGTSLTLIALHEAGELKPETAAYGPGNPPPEFDEPGPVARRCTCVRVEITQGTDVDRHYVMGRKDPNCPWHGCTCPPAQIVGSGGDTIDQADDPNCPVHGGAHES